MGIIYSNKPLPERRENDLYPTPSELCEATIQKHKHFFHNDGIRVLDSGAGEGAWGKEVRKIIPTAIITGVELRNIQKPDGYDNWYNSIDYKYFDKGKYDIILGNPPYRYSEEFIRKSMELLDDYGVLFYLLRLSFLESQKRYDGLFKEFRPLEVSVSVRRVSFSGDKKSDNNAYAIFTWLKNNKLENTGLSWLNWSYK